MAREGWMAEAGPRWGRIRWPVAGALALALALPAGAAALPPPTGGATDTGIPPWRDLVGMQPAPGAMPRASAEAPMAEAPDRLAPRRAAAPKRPGRARPPEAPNGGGTRHERGPAPVLALARASGGRTLDAVRRAGPAIVPDSPRFRPAGPQAPTARVATLVPPPRPQQDPADAAAPPSPPPRPASPAAAPSAPAGSREAATARAVERAPPPRPRPLRPAHRDGPAGTLSLDQAALIGVYEAEDRRRALVRLPDGSVRRVTARDDLLGWTVGAIGRDALRLSRGREVRTLLFVGR